MRVKHKHVSVALCVAGLALAAAGCGSSSSGTAASGSGPVVWWVPGPDLINGTSQAIAKDFTKKTGIKVDMQMYPWAGFTTKVTTAITSGQVPDVVELGNTDVPTLSQSGAFMTWGPSQLQQIGGKAQFVSAALNGYVPKGQQPASVPFYGGAWCLVYNKAMFKQAGISSPPTTWQAFYTDAKKLSHPSAGRYAVAIAGGTPAAMDTWAWIAATQNGVPYYSAAGAPVVDTQKMANVMAGFAKWIYPDQIMSPVSVADNSNGDNAIFDSGKSAMDITQNPQAAFEHPTKYGIGLIPLPSPLPAGGKPVMSHLVGINIAVFKNSPRQAEAIKFVKYLMSNQAQVIAAKGEEGLPVTHSALKSAYFQTPALKEFGAIYSKYSQAPPSGPTSSQLLNDVGNVLVQAFQNDAAAKKVNTAQISSGLKNAQATVVAGG